MFSIITPTYNRSGSNLLRQALESIQSQQKGDFEWEHIVVNDGSSDDTKDFLDVYSKEHKGVVVVNQKNVGPASAIFNGVMASSGDYILILGDDDLLPPDSLLERAKYIEKNPSLDWFYAKAFWINEGGNRIPVEYQSQYFTDHMYERMLTGNIIHGGTLTVKRSVMQAIKKPEWLKRSEDYFVSLELLRPENNYKFGFLDKEIFCYRIHESMYTKSYQGDEKKLAEKMELNRKIKELHGEGLSFLAGEAGREKREREALEELLKNEKLTVSNLEVRISALENENNAIKSTYAWKIINRLESAFRVDRSK